MPRLVDCCFAAFLFAASLAMIGCFVGLLWVGPDKPPAPKACECCKCVPSCGCRN